MVRRWYLAMVGNETCASLCVGEMGSVRDQIVYILLGHPSSPLYGGRGLGIRSSRLQVYANPNWSWASWALSVHLAIGLQQVGRR
jgi:hypothetical protein